MKEVVKEMECCGYVFLPVPVCVYDKATPLRKGGGTSSLTKAIA